jgi:hypothetical protein
MLQTSIDFELQWSAFYAGRQDVSENYHPFRLLDFTTTSGYHYSFYREEFATIQSIETVRDLQPWAFHMPRVTEGLLMYAELVRVGCVNLNKDDLFG